MTPFLFGYARVSPGSNIGNAAARTSPLGAVDRLERPDQDVLACGKHQVRLPGGHETLRQHAVLRDLGGGVLEGPRRVVDLCTSESPVVLHRVEAIALRKEVLERPRRGGSCRPDRGV